MYHKKIKEFIAHEKDDIYKAYWKFKKSSILLLVLNQEDKFAGIVGDKDFKRAIAGNKVYSNVAEITNYNALVVHAEDVYNESRLLFSEHEIQYLPVVNSDGDVLDIISRKRAFYKNYFWNGRLDRMHYASLVWMAAQDALKLGLHAISVIEFGVAGGNGLLNLEFHAREIGRILGIDIQVYGFDTGAGLPMDEHDYRDVPSGWVKGAFPMNYEELSEKLTKAELIIGDVKNTGRRFYEKYEPAPIGAVMIDVDIYNSTVDVLNMLSTDYKYLLPRVYMYFDDIMEGSENLGESLAIKEFNEKHRGEISITPENGRVQSLSPIGSGPFTHVAPTSKVCHYFKHPLYNVYIGGAEEQILPLTVIPF